MSQDARPTYIDLFCGAGGLSLGLQMAGWKCLLAIDDWGEAIQTYRRNLRGHPAVQGDVHELTGEQLSRRFPDAPQWVVGGPPCQGFSTVGKRQREDPRNDLVLQFHRIVSELRPEGFLIENVIGLKDMAFEADVRQVFTELGYSVASMVLRAADYGVPQLRRRIVFVGHLARGFFIGPERTHSEPAYATVWDAIGDLPELVPGEVKTEYDKSPFTNLQRGLRGASKLIQGHEASSHPPHLVRAISFIPDGGNRRSIPDKYQPKSGFHNSYSRLFSKAPAVAVTSNMGKPSATRCIHPFQHRGLSAREGARLQTFPDSFHFEGGVVSQRLQVANAVPPYLGRAIGRGLADASRWADAPTDRSQLTLEEALDLSLSSA